MAEELLMLESQSQMPVEATRHKHKHIHRPDEGDTILELEREIEQLTDSEDYELELIMNEEELLSDNKEYITRLKEKYHVLKLKLMVSERKDELQLSKNDLFLPKFNSEAIAGQISSLEQAVLELKGELLQIRQNVTAHEFSMPALKQLESPTTPSEDEHHAEPQSLFVNNELNSALTVKLLGKITEKVTHITESQNDLEQELQMSVIKVEALETEMVKFQSEEKSNEVNAYELLENIQNCSVYAREQIDEKINAKNDEVNYLSCFYGVLLYIRDVRQNVRSLDSLDDISQACLLSEEQKAYFTEIYRAIAECCK